jgi:hypothetical protein
MSEPEWIDKDVRVERIYIFRNWEGNHYEATVPRDTSDVEEMYRDVTTVSGTILGSFPDLGDVYLSSDAPPTTKAFETGRSGPWVRLNTP